MFENAQIGRNIIHVNKVLNQCRVFGMYHYQLGARTKCTDNGILQSISDMFFRKEGDWLPESSTRRLLVTT